MVSSRIVLAVLTIALVSGGCAHDPQTDSPPAAPTGPDETTSAEASSTHGHSIASGYLISGVADTRPPIDTFGMPPRAEGAAPVDPSPESPGVSVAAVSIENTDNMTSIVYELKGDGYVGYSVRTVDRALRYSDSKPLDIDGRGIVQIDFTGTADGPTGRQNLEPPVPVVSLVSSIVSTRYGDGVTQSFVGLGDSQSPIQVEAMERPTRLRVSVAAP
ncbi:hypothetical protein [Rhodococcus sp. 1168]|uniref:AMIN-like domain-containing (lipo)protein n=1 Tax=Rhodococcus sp. 1168 TaxID=2018041 RepID=UPI00111C4363|nr:hypothetical protein [Rhodococcus sp. 1168]